MSRLIEVIKNKNKVDKAGRSRRKNEIIKLRAQTAFKARLYDELRHIDIILEDKDVEAVIITIPDEMQAYFSEALYSDDLVGYKIEQLPGASNKFRVEKKFISF